MEQRGLFRLGSYRAMYNKVTLLEYLRIGAVLLIGAFMWQNSAALLRTFDSTCKDEDRSDFLSVYAPTAISGDIVVYGTIIATTNKALSFLSSEDEPSEGVFRVDRAVEGVSKFSEGIVSTKALACAKPLSVGQAGYLTGNWSNNGGHKVFRQRTSN